MFTLSRALWQDEAGFIVSAELVMVGTVLIVGLIAGMACIQDAVIGEYTEVAGALRGLDQSYSASGMHGCWNPCCGFTSWTAGSAYYQHGVEREVCFGLCPPGPIVYPPVVTPPVIPVPDVPPVTPPVPVPVPEGTVVPAPCVPVVPIPCDSAVPAVPCIEEPAGPRPCPCSKKDCPPNESGECPQPTVIPLPGPFVW